MHLEGLLPPVYESLELQSARIMEQLSFPNLLPLNKYNILKEILATNQTLFYKTLVDNIDALAPIVYTPTVGEACRRFDLLYREPMGFYLSGFQHRGRFAQVLGTWPSKNVAIIVVSDGGRILGLGDLGVNGMGIPLGKISLFVGAGGFHPEHSLPLMLDVGTNNEELLADKFYMGERRRRLEGDEYWSVIQELCDAVKSIWPDALLQFEDFETSHAFGILQRHRNRLLCFNDDIQGTGAVVTAGIINGLRVQHTQPRDARIVFFGAGSSAVGVAEGIAAYLEHEVGVSREKARRALYLVDSKGLVTTSRGDTLPAHKRPFARDPSEPDFPGDIKELKAIVGAVKPHAVIGLSAAGPSWPREVIQELCHHVDRPLVFPLSNPTEKSEITAEQAYDWSDGKAVFASGSPFDPLERNGKRLVPGQANNVFIFPGVGFGAVMAKAKTVTDGMFTVAAKALASCVSKEELAVGQLYPSMAALRQTSLTVATAVAKAAWDEGQSKLDRAPQDWRAYVSDLQWWPEDVAKGRSSGADK